MDYAWAAGMGGRELGHVPDLMVYYQPAVGGRIMFGNFLGRHQIGGHGEAELGSRDCLFWTQIGSDRRRQQENSYQNRKYDQLNMKN
jgi:hypothetical protein